MNIRENKHTRNTRTEIMVHHPFTLTRLAIATAMMAALVILVAYGWLPIPA